MLAYSGHPITARVVSESEDKMKLARHDSFTRASWLVSRGPPSDYCGLLPGTGVFSLLGTTVNLGLCEEVWEGVCNEDRFMFYIQLD